jgi:peroxisomal 3,2-trans-enoyl-CoA isomerase
MASTVSVEISGPIATITFNRPHSLNAITAEGILLYRYYPTHPHRIIFLDYNAFANALRNIDKNPVVTVTIWQGGPYIPSPPHLPF